MKGKIFNAQEVQAILSMIKILKQYLSLRGLLARRLREKRKKIYSMQYRIVNGIKENGLSCWIIQYKSRFGFWKPLKEESFAGAWFPREYENEHRAKERLYFFKKQQRRSLLSKVY